MPCSASSRACSTNLISRLPGTYTIHTEEEMLDTLSFVGWRQIGCAIVLHREGAEEHVTVDPQELREALVRDGDQGTDPPAAPSVAMGRNRRANGPMRRAGRSTGRTAPVPNR